MQFDKVLRGVVGEIVEMSHEEVQQVAAKAEPLMT